MPTTIFQLNFLEGMEERYVPLAGGRIHYHRFGRGLHQVICFHGYGEEGSTFAFLEKVAGDSFTFFCPDLPFHGKTEWPVNVPFTTGHVQDFIKLVLGYGDSPFLLMGFSLGGRIALSVYEQEADRVKKLLLLAPDGLKVNFWYWLATQTRVGNRLFRLTMKRPQWFMGMLNLFNKLGWVNPSVFKFVKYYIGDADTRNLLYQRWTSLRKIRPKLRSVRLLISSMYTTTRLVYGRHDRIILSSVGKRFIKGIEKQSRIDIIESGHQVLHRKHADHLVSLLNE